MTNLNQSYIKAIRSIIVVSLYFVWPTLIKFFVNLFNVNNNEIVSFIGYIILLIIIFGIYFKYIKSSLNSISIKKILRLLVALILIQILTNLISVLILGLDGHINNIGLLPQYLEKWPILMTFNLLIIYPILETLVFNKTLKDIINYKWLFIICSSLFFWFVNLLSFDFSIKSIIATMSCFTTSIVINYFYYKEDNISSIIMVKMIYNFIFLLLP